MQLSSDVAAHAHRVRDAAVRAIAAREAAAPYVNNNTLTTFKRLSRTAAAAAQSVALLLSELAKLSRVHPDHVTAYAVYIAVSHLAVEIRTWNPRSPIIWPSM